MADDEKGGRKIHLHIDEPISQGTYSNLVVINHAENEFVIDFAWVQPQSGHAKVASRIISSPRHTKRMLAALQKNVDRYEAKYGPIETSVDEEPIVH